MAAAFGVVAHVLQGGWAGRLVGIDTETPLPAFVPVIMFAVLFGLSMDYEVFLVRQVSDHQGHQSRSSGHESWVLVSRFRLPPATTSPQAARERLRVELADWGDDEARHSVLLLVTELVTNAVLHARSEVTIHVEVTSDVLRVQVDDESPAPPMRLDASSDLPGGRGLHLLDSLTRRWGVLTGSRGKTVWFEIAPEPA